MAQARARSHGERDVRENFDALRSALDTLRNNFESFAAERGEDGGDLLATGQEKVRKIKDKVEERPFVSLGLALATGFMIWGLLSRR